MTDEKSKYRIDVSAYGGIKVEAPTKDECISLFNEAAAMRRKNPINEAIR